MSDLSQIIKEAESNEVSFISNADEGLSFLPHDNTNGKCLQKLVKIMLKFPQIPLNSLNFSIYPNFCILGGHKLDDFIKDLKEELKQQEMKQGKKGLK